mmetsp:Transcript_68846/g.185527  ORF Transcript_68846/g.185527 Transcript_68846/m.185527 type:complete len:283 (+) Transcript_68846:157-1005(+)
MGLLLSLHPLWMSQQLRPRRLLSPHPQRPACHPRPCRPLKAGVRHTVFAGRSSRRRMARLTTTTPSPASPGGFCRRGHSMSLCRARKRMIQAQRPPPMLAAGARPRGVAPQPNPVLRRARVPAAVQDLLRPRPPRPPPPGTRVLATDLQARARSGSLSPGSKPSERCSSSAGSGASTATRRGSRGSSGTRASRLCRSWSERRRSRKWPGSWASSSAKLMLGLGLLPARVSLHWWQPRGNGVCSAVPGMPQRLCRRWPSLTWVRTSGGARRRRRTASACWRRC